MSAPSAPSPGGNARVAVESPLLALSGTVLEARYELGRALGAGGMGAVFEAKHLRLGRMVAIKVLRPALVGHDEHIQRFIREAQVASKIRHRNVVEIHDYGEAPGGLVYIVMELLRGQDLDCFLEAQPEARLPWWQASSLLFQAARGLKAAHAVGIVHRDIKPANCFLTTDEEGQPLVKLLDFGIAKAEDSEPTQRLTATSAVLGTPSYIAPELVLTTQPASPRSDIYSLGVVAYRMLTGRVPFTGATAFQVLHAACFEPVPPLRGYAPDVPPAVEALVLQMLAKAPEDRPPSMQTVRDALVVLLNDGLGVQAVEIPVSGSLPLGASEPTNPFASSSKTLPMGQTIGDGAAHASSDTPPTEILPMGMDPPRAVVQPRSLDVGEATLPPQSTGLVHALAFLYLTMGQAPDDNITPEEMRTLADKLHRRAPDLSREQLGQVLRQTVQTYKAAHTRAEKLERALQYTSLLRNAIDVGMRRAIVVDLRAVAEADGVVSAEELGFISAAARTLGLEHGG
jgi:serine/threonine protein kinase